MVAEFRCPKCRTVIELQRKMDDETHPLCCNEGCDGIEMDRLISLSSFQLKGGGWSKDGYSK